MIKAIIIDDELSSRNIIENYVTKYCDGVEVVGKAENIIEGEKLIRSNNIDLLFLDIEMPFGNGFDLLEKFDNINFEVIFITAFSEYAIQALNMSAAYYILKPVDIQELVNATNKVKEKFQKENIPFAQILANNLKSSKKKIALPQLDGFEVIEVSKIIRAEASDNYTLIYTDDDQKFVASKTLKYFEDMLKEHDFLRTHKSHLVNLNHVIGYKKGKVGSVELTDGSSALVTSSAKKFLNEFFLR